MEVAQDASVDRVSQAHHKRPIRADLANPVRPFDRPCVVFNNVRSVCLPQSRRSSNVPADSVSQATSLPLLLLESLGTTGTLKQLMRDGETMDDLLNRGRVSLES